MSAARLVLAGMIMAMGALCPAAAGPSPVARPVSGSEEQEAPSPLLQETGSYVRSYWHIPLYRITLETPDPRQVVSLYRQAAGCALQPGWEALTTFLLSPQNHIEIRVSLQMLINLKGYRDESRCLRQSLGRMGLAIEENWRLKTMTDLQGEVFRLAEALIGLSADRPGTYYRDRRKGDVYVFSFDGRGNAALSYQPAVDNRSARPGRTEFGDSRVAAAFAGALLLPAAGEEGASSAALLGCLRDAWSAEAVTAEMRQSTVQGQT